MDRLTKHGIVNIKTDDINATRKALVVTVSADEIEKEHDTILGDFAKEARLPGFRPGRAPKPMVAKRFAREIGEELKKRVVSNAYRQAVKESGVEVFQPVDLKGDEIERGRDNELNFVVDINPEFNLPEYKGIPLPKTDTEVKDDEVERTIDTLRQQRADYSVVEREAQKGDYVKLSYEGKVDGRPIAEIAEDRPIFGTQTGTWEEVGSEDAGIPGFTDQLAGLKAGDKNEIKVSFPAEFPHEALAGKDAVYSVEMIEVREKKLPEIDDEFLKGLNVESLDQLKEQIVEELAGRKKMDGRARQRQQLGDTLLERIEFAVPESAIEMETDGLLRQIIERNIRQGVSEEELEKHKEQIFEESRKSAVKRIKLRMILMKIAEAEKIKIENEDVQRHLMQEAMQRGMRPDDLVKEMRKDEHVVQAMRQNILFDKTLDFLLEEANISESET
jgi:trigger factor